MPPIRHLFWDFDGTLYNSYPQIAHAFGQALNELGQGGLISEAGLLALLKVSVYHAACHCAQKAGLEPAELIEVFHRYHAQEAPFAPYAGLEGCLRTLHEAGIRHYLYTHRDLRAVEQLKRDGLWPLFTDAVTRLDGFADKPAPDALLALMARNNAEPGECAMVGDRDIDILSGRNAGMRGVLFDPDGFYPDLKADWRVSSMAELCGLFV